MKSNLRSKEKEKKKNKDSHRDQMKTFDCARHLKVFKLHLKKTFPTHSYGHLNMTFFLMYSSSSDDNYTINVRNVETMLKADN